MNNTVASIFAALLVATTAAVADAATPLPFAGFYSYQGCNVDTDDGFVIKSDGHAFDNNYAGHWTLRGDILTVDWVIRKGEKDSTDKSKWRRVENFQLSLRKGGKYVLQGMKHRKPIPLCKKET